MKKILRISLLILFFLIVVFNPIFASPLFGDIPNEHWAKDALATLAAKGLIEGYPDGTFKGDRAGTRWEMALVVARMLAKAEQNQIFFTSREDLETLKKIALAYKEELESLGVRTNVLEDSYDKLEKRIYSLEHIKFYGSIDSIYAGQSFGGILGAAGQANAFTVNDWSNGRPLINGRALSSIMRVGFNSSLPNFTLGGEFAGYYAQGEPAVDSYWGVTPPYLSNNFTAASGGANFASMNTPFSQLSFDNFYLKHEPTKTNLILGAYELSKIDKFILIGQRNPNINPPYILPFFGSDLSGSFKFILKNPIAYEVMYSKMPSASNAAAPTTNYYNTNLLALNLSYNFNLNEKVKALATLNYLTSINERVSEGVMQAPSLITIPARSDPAGANRSQGWFTWANVGPQKEGIAGGSLTLDFPHNFKLIGEYSYSKYVPDLSFTNFRGTTLPIKGALFRGAIEYNPQNWNFNLDYVAVAPTYDPMLFAYPSSATIPVFLPYSTFYSNYYQLHDNLKYPNNRQGFKFNTAYNFKQGKVNLSYGSLEQKFSSNRRNLLSTGFIEVFFPELRGGTMEEKGNIKDLGLTLNYIFPNNLKTNIAYYNYKIKRASTNLNDDMDLAENVGQFGLAYPFNRKFSLSGNYTLITYKGHFVDQTNQDFRQYIPSLSASYQMSSNALVLATYRVYDFTNNAVTASNWNGRQTTLEVKFNF